MKFRNFGIRTLIIGIAMISGIIVGSFCIRTAISNQNHTQAPIYPKNESGQTYGSSADAISIETEPDLILALGVDGTAGYVRASDLNEDMPKTPQEAVERMKKNGAKGDRQIPLYDIDGKTVIGEFKIHNTKSDEILNEQKSY